MYSSTTASWRASWSSSDLDSQVERIARRRSARLDADAIGLAFQGGQVAALGFADVVAGQVVGVGGDAGAEERTRGIELPAVGDTHDEVLVAMTVHNIAVLHATNGRPDERDSAAPARWGSSKPLSAASTPRPEHHAPNWRTCRAEIRHSRDELPARRCLPRPELMPLGWSDAEPGSQAIADRREELPAREVGLVTVQPTVEQLANLVNATSGSSWMLVVRGPRAPDRTAVRRPATTESLLRCRDAPA